MSASVFPAYVGMSPAVVVGGQGEGSVPRIRGDEPSEAAVSEIVRMCSPHTWG